MDVNENYYTVVKGVNRVKDCSTNLAGDYFLHPPSCLLTV